MRADPLFRAHVPLFIVALLASCSGSTNPYRSLTGAPLVRSYLHTVTLVIDDATLVDRLQQRGYRRLSFPPNYPDVARIEGMIWDVPTQVAAAGVVLASPDGNGPNVRVLVMPVKPHVPADADVEHDFFRNVLGWDVPHWPAGALPMGARVQAWTYLIEDANRANEKLQKAGIAVIFAPTALKSPYLGDHRSLAIRAPDGSVVELVQGSAQ